MPARVMSQRTRTYWHLSACIDQKTVALRIYPPIALTLTYQPHSCNIYVRACLHVLALHFHLLTQTHANPGRPSASTWSSGSVSKRKGGSSFVRGRIRCEHVVWSACVVSACVSICCVSVRACYVCGMQVHGSQILCCTNGGCNVVRVSVSVIFDWNSSIHSRFLFFLFLKLSVMCDNRKRSHSCT